MKFRFAGTKEQVLIGSGSERVREESLRPTVPDKEGSWLASKQKLLGTKIGEDSRNYGLPELIVFITKRDVVTG